MASLTMASQKERGHQRSLWMTMVWLVALSASVEGFALTPTPKKAVVMMVAKESQLFGGRRGVPTTSSNNKSTTSLKAVSVNNNVNGFVPSEPTLSPLASKLTQMGLTMFILGMCVTLPLTLFPQLLLLKCGIINKTQSEKMALWTGQFCARWMLRLIPFCNIETIAPPVEDQKQEACVWVCNHASMLDVFILLGSDLRLRGKKKRPIKIVYWKQLEDNFVTKILFRQCGFIPVNMADNGNGTENDYDRGSFRTLLKESKRALAEGFDVGILPEGQLNPSPETGLLPIFSGAYTLARMSKRPIATMSLFGTHKLWHPTEGMSCTSRNIKVRCYPEAHKYDSAEEFKAIFSKVAGYFGQYGRDIPDVEAWLDGSMWSKKNELQESSPM